MSHGRQVDHSIESRVVVTARLHEVTRNAAPAARCLLLLETKAEVPTLTRSCKLSSGWEFGHADGRLMLVIFDWLLGALHLLVVLGNLFLWIPPKTRRVHLVLVLLTAASWLGLGLFYGLGYCFLTDWHWQIKRALGARGLPGGFIHYLLDSLGLVVAPKLVDTIVAGTFAIVFTLSLIVNFRARKRTH